MQKLTFSENIHATPQRIWTVMLDDPTYRQWTAVFQEGSYAVTDWQEGSRTLFLDGKGNGMVSTIKTHRPNQFLSIEHLGTVKNGVEDVTSESVKAWAGAHENYSLTQENGACTLTVEMDVTGDMLGYFNDTWPKALAKLKEIAES